MVSNTRAIILRTVNYGETSMIVTAFTSSFGLQSYMMKGARSVGKKGQSIRPYLIPGAILDLVTYSHQARQLQYIKDLQWGYIYKNNFTSVLHHTVAIYLVELITLCLKQTEDNISLYQMTGQYLLLLDEAEAGVVANLPLHFTLELAGTLGFRPEANFSEANHIFDLHEGCFVEDIPHHQMVITGKEAMYTQQLLLVEQPVTLYRIKMNRSERLNLLKSYEQFFKIHVDGFNGLKSLEVLKSLF